MSGTIRTRRPAQGRLGPREGWIWAVLPADCGRVEVHGDESLAQALTDAGCDVVPASSGGADAILAAADPAIRPDDAVRLAADLEADALLVVLVSAASSAHGRRRRAALAPLSLASGLRRTLRAARIARGLEAAGLRVRRIDTGNRAVRHAIDVRERGWRRANPLRHPILLASSGEAAASAAAQARDAAAASCGTRLLPRRAHVLASGTLMTEVEADDGRLYLLRVAGGGAAQLLEKCERVQRVLAGAETPAAVQRRLVAPVAGGTIGAVRWSLEPRVPGSHPTRLTDALWTECLEFLAALRRAPTPAWDADAAMATAADIVQAHVSERERAVLRRVAGVVDERLAPVARGWCHGDFWTANMLARRGSLTTVLDWDAATPSGPPLVDLLHLISYSDRSLRRLPHGLRCTRRLWPLARAGGNAAMRRYCDATATPTDPAVLESLAIAYWLSRAARDLRLFADRGQRRRWLADNVHSPLQELEAAGW